MTACNNAHVLFLNEWQWATVEFLQRFGGECKAVGSHCIHTSLRLFDPLPKLPILRLDDFIFSFQTDDDERLQFHYRESPISGGTYLIFIEG
jgi:hypothetical protein